MKKLFVLLAVVTAFSAFSQPDVQRSTKMTILGDDYFQVKNYIDAIGYYKAAIETNPKNTKAQYKLAESYRLIQDYESAEYHYETIAQEQDMRFPLAGFHYASMQKLKGRYESALKGFKAFRQFLVENDLHESDEFRSYYKQAKIEIDGCQLALNQITLVHPDHQFQPLSAPLNSEYNDYAAFSVGSDGVVCLTSARGSGKSSLVDKQFGESFADLFRFENKNGTWEEYDQGDRFEKIINTKYGDGSGSFNRERTKFYYTNCDDDLEVCHIYISKLEGGRWSEPKPLNSNINDYETNSKHPNLTPGGDTLFFVSDREGGFGQLDIYMSINAGEDNWGIPVNLGPQINTPFNEVSPFYDPGEQVLFFSSDGHRGFGGYDIYVARGTKFESAEIYNAGIPFNSYKDDIFFFLGNKQGYLSSNREDENAVGKFDIYGFNIRSKSSIISDVSNEGTIAGRNSLFTDDYNFDSNETEIINQIISRMLSSSVSDVELILTQRQLEVYNALSEDDKERIKKIVNARVRKMTSNMIRSIRTEDDYYYQQLSTDKRRKVDNIVSTYLEQQGMGNSVNLSNEVFSFYSGVSNDEREKIDILISDRLKNAQDFTPATPTYNSFAPKEQKSLDGIAIKYLKQKRNLESIALDMNEKVFMRDNKETRGDDVNAAVRERLIGLSNEEKYRLVKEDRDFYETLTEEEKEKLKSIAQTFMLSDLSNFDQNVSNSDLDVFKNKNSQDQNRLDKLLLKQISNLANSSIYLTETTFSQSELQAALSETSEETVDKLLEMRPGLSDFQRKAVERFVKTAYDSYLGEAKPIFFDTTPTVVSTPGVGGGDPSARLTDADVNQYETLSESKKRAIDNLIALDYIVSEYQDRSVKLSDEHKKTKLSGEEKVHVAALAKKVSGGEIKPAEQAYIRSAFVYYNNLSQDRKAFINRVVLDKGLPKRNSNYVLPEADARARTTLSVSEKDLMDRIKRFRFNNDRILTENLALDAKDVDEAPVDLIALAGSVPPSGDPGAEKIMGAEDILASEELDEIKITLPINRIEGYDEITITGKLVGSGSGSPLSSYPIKLIQFDNTKTVIEGYTNASGEFEFKVTPEKYDLTFKKASASESVVLEDFNVEGRREKEAGVYTNATRAFFDVNSSELRPEVKILLDDVVASFRKSGNKIEIESHTDDTGAAEYNLILSKDRGYSARDYLINKGVDQSKISVIWHGSEKPIADNNNPYGRQLNRRIDIRLIGNRRESFGNFYLVRPGATVTKIASSMGVAESHIKTVNGLGADGLQAYKPIRLIKSGEIEADFNLVVPADIKSGSDFIYTVQPGDDLTIVSEKFNVPEELIMEQNGLNSTELEPGTRLIIYPKN
ncbi:OmpA family protein [Ekhidna sp.]|uniref:OmpA family protein n=1 Tax=Ekhidna sp. TaxID=2608089 RepID=UPI003CCBC88E